MIDCGYRLLRCRVTKTEQLAAKDWRSWAGLAFFVLICTFMFAAQGFAASPSKDVLDALKSHPYFGYNIIILVDKARSGSSLHAQRLRYYRYDPQTKRLSYVARWRTSTGAEEAKENKLGRITPRTTLPGYYAVEVLQENAYSNSWDGPMALSMFYDYPRYAIHATEWYNYFKLGKRASGGCTRLTMDHALQLFNEIKTLGKGWTYELNRYTGQPARTASGAPVVRWGYRAMAFVQDGSELEPTHFGFREIDTIYASNNSAANFIDFPKPAIPDTPTPSFESGLQKINEMLNGPGQS